MAVRRCSVIQSAELRRARPQSPWHIRVAGNVADAVALGSMECAVEHFPVKILIVLGHEKCGAVIAAASGEKPPTPNLEALVKKIDPALAPLRARASGDELAQLPQFGEETARFGGRAVRI